MKREFYPYLTIARFLAAVGVDTYHGSNSLFGLNPTFRIPIQYKKRPKASK
jgi:peptidoglycan/LPS O-acetylase OafA/YrhL